MVTIFANAHGGWNPALGTQQRPEAGGWYAVTGTDAQVAAYVERTGDRICFDAEDLDPQVAPFTVMALNPTCEHGMSAQLCYGPGHYPTYGVNTMDPTWR